MSKFAQDIILKPVVTEESMLGTALKKYTFVVAKDANKIEIAKACEELFDVKVLKVNTVNVRGHLRRYGLQDRPERDASRRCGTQARCREPRAPLPHRPRFCKTQCTTG